MKATFIKRVSAIILTIAMGIGSASAQYISKQNEAILKAKEDSLKAYAEYLNTDSLTADRMISDSSFTKTLVRALVIKNSFYYPFDSLKGINKLYAPDSSFRIITWNINFSDYYNRQKGAIQLKTNDGSLKLFPLRDVSEFTENTQDSIRTARNWIGAMYYNMVLKEFNGKKYYTLFGFDNNNAMSSIKWIEVLWFNEKSEPQFGGPFFSYEKDSVRKATQYRYQTEFKKGASILVNYIADMDLILVDHLVSENNDPEHKWTYVPDGDQEGFKWENGKWIHINKVFNQKLEDGQAPIEKPVFNKENDNGIKKSTRKQ
jgi:hypothetical protein